MFTKKLLQELLKHLKTYGGATLTSAGNYCYFKSGYIVSLKGFEYRTPKLTIKDLKKYFDLARSYGVYVGLWIDDNGLYCLDLSEKENDLQRALYKAYTRAQDCIYNCKTGDYIATK